MWLLHGLCSIHSPKAGVWQLVQQTPIVQTVLSAAAGTQHNQSALHHSTKAQTRSSNRRYDLQNLYGETKASLKLLPQ